MKFHLALAAGLSLLAAAPAAQADLIQNGGFESGFADWTTNGDAAEDGFAHSGVFAGEIGTHGFWSQTISDTAGQTLQLTYWLATERAASHFEVDWNGTAIAGSVLNNFNLTNYVEYVFTVVATGSDTLKLAGDGGTNSFVNFDDISLAPASVPEPTSLALIASGLLGTAALRRRKRSQKS